MINRSKAKSDRHEEWEAMVVFSHAVDAYRSVLMRSLVSALERGDSVNAVRLQALVMMLDHERIGCIPGPALVGEDVPE